MIFAFVVLASLSAEVEISTSATPLLTLEQHDYVYPRLSPDGTRLVVARALERADGTETTDVLLIDVASRVARELISQRDAEANETYETFVVGLRWLDNGRVEVCLSDGDVGGTALVVDASTGTIVASEHTDDGDSLVPTDFADLAANAAVYSRHFSRDELERSLGTSAVRVSTAGVLLQRTARQTTRQPIFYIEPTKRRIRRIATVPKSVRLWDAVQIGSKILFLMIGENVASVHSYDSRAATTLTKWSVSTRNQCPRIEAFSNRLFVFVRPCTRSEPARATLWEVTRGAAILRALDDNLDEFSVCADGSRIAVAVWRNGRRIVQVFDGSVLRAAG